MYCVFVEWNHFDVIYGGLACNVIIVLFTRLVHDCLYMCVLCVYVHVCTCKCMCGCGCACVCMCTSMCTYVLLYVTMCTLVYVSSLLAYILSSYRHCKHLALNSLRLLSMYVSA